MHEDSTKNLRAYVSFDPAIDRDAMGDDFYSHFGRYGAADVARNGMRNPAMIRVVPGMRACSFELRPLTLAERFECDSVVSPEHRLVRALGYALVHAELFTPLSSEQTTLHANASVPGFSLDALGKLMEFVGVEALYELGAVAYTRSRLGPFVVPFAPVLPTSVQRQVTLLLHHADTLARTTSATQSTSAASTSSTSSQEQTAPSAKPGDATAPENGTAPPDATTPP